MDGLDRLRCLSKSIKPGLRFLASYFLRNSKATFKFWRGIKSTTLLGKRVIIIGIYMHLYSSSSKFMFFIVKTSKVFLAQSLTDRSNCGITEEGVSMVFAT